MCLQPDVPSPDVTVADAGTVDTLLAFLTTSCASCKPFWDMMATTDFAALVGCPSGRGHPEPFDGRRAPRPGAAARRAPTCIWGPRRGSSTAIGTSASFVLVRCGLDGPEPWEQAGQVTRLRQRQKPRRTGGAGQAMAGRADLGLRRLYRGALSQRRPGRRAGGRQRSR